MENIETGCASGGCGCGEGAARAKTTRAAAPAPAVNGVALHAPGVEHDAATLRELAWAELLRQRAVELGYLPAGEADVAPELDDKGREAIDAMLDAEVPEMAPSADECRRHYEANAAQFTVGQSLKLRHVLFAVTDGVDVQKLIRRAEDALLEVSKKGVSPERFAQLAAELSNCPSGASGGDLGWVAPHELSPELARELFFKPEVGLAKGLQPRLIHSRFGLHIVDVTEQKPGHLPPFEEVSAQIAVRLAQRSRATALGQYMRILVGNAELTGIALEGETSPLVQ